MPTLGNSNCAIPGLHSEKEEDRNLAARAVRYNDIYRMDEIKSISFHIMFYRLYRGVAKYIVSGNNFS